ncbi:sporulation protein [Thermoactinomyces mirandus]|uniref:Sporulation protein n=1 Tax=Thermoactinomyces mirandus TaxID=2756294 RepID=A0A7W2AS06_9BACL|nr:sporulation protein [Thermoactinomyces mirandus]MBA4602180.1 sporulation protein [Thermoactinomyces mirandus]
MLRNFLASLGFGAAKIDLVLESSTLTMGEPVSGKIFLEGGEAEQLIEKLNVHFCLASSYKKGDRIQNVNETIVTIPIDHEEFVIDPGEKKEYDFYFKCPVGLPVSSINTRYFFKTDLEISSGIDAEDRDFISVEPSGLLKNFLDGFAKLGLVHYGEEYTGRRDGSFQTIQFHPTAWLRGKYDEIVFTYKTTETENSIRGYFELDKKTSGLIGRIADELDLDERKGKFYFSAQELATVEKAAETLQNFIMKNSAGLIGG